MPGISFKGQGKSSTTWCNDGVVNPLLKMGRSSSPAGSYHFSIEDIRFEGLVGCNNLLYISYAAYFNIRRCYFTGASVVLFYTYGALSYSVSECKLQGGTGYAVDIYGDNVTGDTANNITFFHNEISKAFKLARYVQWADSVEEMNEAYAAFKQHIDWCVANGR